MKGSRLKVGARGSDLSLAQTRWLIGELVKANPGLEVELVVIETHGDRDQNSSLADLGVTGGFVKDIEKALLEERIDLAVHSLKDMPVDPVPGLTIAAIPVRAPANDVLLTRTAQRLEQLPTGFRIGSSSPRRSHQIKHFAPQVKIEALRGNVPTRIRKLREGAYDGIMLAAAGLKRLGLSHEFTIDLDPVKFPPAPGQGALALQSRESGLAREIGTKIDHATTRAAVTAERAFLKATGGGCHAAAGAYARVHHGQLEIHGQVFISEKMVAARLVGPIADAERLGAEVANQLLHGARLK
jgi:hydroxymethylbilane synthase